MSLVLLLNSRPCAIKAANTGLTQEYTQICLAEQVMQGSQELSLWQGSSWPVAFQRDSGHQRNGRKQEDLESVYCIYNCTLPSLCPILSCLPTLPHIQDLFFNHCSSSHMNICIHTHMQPTESISGASRHQCLVPTVCYGLSYQ